jgi:hypothetical protein
MNKAGWVDVWHLVLAIVARQPPFTQIMIATGAALAVVMAVEGLRTSLLAIWRAHRIPAPPPPAVDRTTAPVKMASPPQARGFSAKSAFAAARRPKPPSSAPRSFRSPRPSIRRYPTQDIAARTETLQVAADAPAELSEAF